LRWACERSSWFRVHKMQAKHWNCANQQASLALDVGNVAADGVTLSVVVVLVLVPGLGLGVAPLRGGRAVALRVEPPGYRCLAP
jgi:hypothetical protein